MTSQPRPNQKPDTSNWPPGRALSYVLLQAEVPSIKTEIWAKTSKNGPFSTLCQNGTLFSTFFGTTIPLIDAPWRVLSIYMGMLGGYRVCEKCYLQKTENFGLSQLLAHFGTKERWQSNSDQRPLLSSGWKVLWHIWIFLMVQVEEDMNFYFLRAEKNCDVTVTSQPRPIWKPFSPMDSHCRCL